MIPLVSSNGLKDVFGLVKPLIDLASPFLEAHQFHC